MHKKLKEKDFNNNKKLKGNKNKWNSYSKRECKKLKELELRNKKEEKISYNVNKKLDMNNSK